MAEERKGVKLHIIGYAGTGGMTLRCEGCERTFPWSSSRVKPEVPFIGLNYCPSCGEPAVEIVAFPTRPSGHSRAVPA